MIPKSGDRLSGKIMLQKYSGRAVINIKRLCSNRSIPLAEAAIVRDDGIIADHHMARMHGGKPVARAFLSSCPVGAEEDAGKGLISIRHQLEEIERVVAAKQKHAAHPEGADDFRFRLRRIDAFDAQINAVARDLDVPIGVKTPGGAGRELAPIRPE